MKALAFRYRVCASDDAVAGVQHNRDASECVEKRAGVQRAAVRGIEKNSKQAAGLRQTECTRQHPFGATLECMGCSHGASARGDWPTGQPRSDVAKHSATTRGGTY
jgi:hypothetical protein